MKNLRLNDYDCKMLNTCINTELEKLRKIISGSKNEEANNSLRYDIRRLGKLQEYISE